MNRVRHGTNVVNYRRELKELKSSFANLQAQHDRDAKKHDKIQGDLQKTKSTASKQAAVIKSLHRQNATLQSSNADLVRKLEGATERIRRLEAKLVCNFKDDREQPDLKRTVDAQAATIQTQSEKLATYEATIEATVEEIDVLSRALNIKVQEYRQQNAQETVQCTLLFEFARAQKDLQTLEQNLKEKTDHVDELLSQLEAAQTNVSELRTRNQHLERAVAQQQNKISEDNMNLVELREKKELVSAERQLLLDQIENISAERDRHRSAAERLAQQYEEVSASAEARLREAELKAAEATQQAEQAKVEMQKLHHALQQNTQALTQAHDGTEQLADEVQRLQMKCSQAEAETQLLREVGRSQAELSAGLQKQLDNAERKNAHLEASLTEQARRLETLSSQHGLLQKQRLAYMHAYEEQQAQLLRKTKKDILEQTNLMHARLTHSAPGVGGKGPTAADIRHKKLTEATQRVHENNERLKDTPAATPAVEQS